MDQQRKKWITFSLIAASALLGYVLSEIMTQLVGSFNLESRLTSLGIRTDIRVLVRVTALAVGLLTFLILSRNKKVNTYLDEVVGELSKVTWPTSSDAGKITIVVMIMVVICGAVFAVQDVFWAWVMKAGIERLTGVFH